MADWSYVALAYTIVWGAIGGYALLLWRRISESRAAVDHLRPTVEHVDSSSGQEDPVCDAPSVP